MIRRPDGSEPEQGRFTFKRFAETSAGRSLLPLSTNPAHGPEGDTVHTQIWCLEDERRSPAQLSMHLGPPPNSGSIIRSR